MHRKTATLQSFDCQAELIPPSTPAAPRSPERSRSFDPAAPDQTPSLQPFDCQMADLPQSAEADPRPEGKERRLPVSDPIVGRGPVEQKVVSILLDIRTVAEEKASNKEEYFREYLSEGWKVRQLTSISTGGSCGWVVVLLEREPNQPLPPMGPD